MPDTEFWRKKVGELSNKKLTLKEQADKATGADKKRLQEQMTILQMDLERAQEELNKSRRQEGISGLAR